MSLEIRQVESREEWEAFIDAARPHTFLQSWAWGEFYVRTGHDIRRLGLYDGARFLGCALVIRVRARRGSFLFCPHGPILRADVGASVALPVLIAALGDLARSWNCDFIRISPLLAANREYARLFNELGFRSAPIHMHPELAWLLDITPPEDELLRNMRKTTRYSIRKAESDGVRVRMSRDPLDAETFWSVYKDTADRQHFVPFSKDYLRREFEAFGPEDRALWFFAEYQGAVLSAALIVFDAHAGYYHQGASVQTHPKITASYLLQWRAIQEAKKRGCSVYNFWGIAPPDRPRHPWAGLSLFKTGFGGFAEEYLHAQDLVLRPYYWLTWGIETARRIKRGL